MDIQVHPYGGSALSETDVTSAVIRYNSNSAHL